MNDSSAQNHTNLLLNLLRIFKDRAFFFFKSQFYVFGAEVGGEMLQYIPSQLSLILLLFLHCSYGLTLS